jgi:transcriptional regulator with XRE-family HTH domain
LRSILARNIKTGRAELRLTQEKLAEYADISLPYMTDIERCRTWVSERTLTNIARALHREPYELLIPAGNGSGEGKAGAGAGDWGKAAPGKAGLKQLAGLVDAKMRLIERYVNSAMHDLTSELAGLLETGGQGGANWGEAGDGELGTR